MSDTKLKIEYIDISQINPYENNAKEHPDWQVDQIVESIKKFGNCDPIGVWTNENGELVVVEGHGRLMALNKLGADTAPVIRLDHLSDEQRRAYGIVHNQTTMNSGWDDSKLRDELESFSDIDMNDFGFDEMLNSLREGDSGEENPKYSQRIQVPIYEPKGENPDESELYDTSVYERLVSDIDMDEEITDEQRQFLMLAAARHVSFSFSKIAEYYAHADQHMKKLMEDSALVIVDYNKAVELGCIRASSRIDALMGGGDIE